MRPPCRSRLRISIAKKCVPLCRGVRRGCLQSHAPHGSRVPGLHEIESRFGFRYGEDELPCEIPILTRVSFLIRMKVCPPLHEHSPPGFLRPSRAMRPVGEWLKSLPVENRKQIGSDILAVQWAWPAGKPPVDSLGAGLWDTKPIRKEFYREWKNHCQGRFCRKSPIFV